MSKYLVLFWLAICFGCLIKGDFNFGMISLALSIAYHSEARIDELEKLIFFKHEE